jgi:hypothetical protein
MLQKLYYPELEEAMKPFFEANLQYVKWIIDGRREIIEQKKKGIPAIECRTIPGLTFCQ